MVRFLTSASSWGARLLEGGVCSDLSVNGPELIRGNFLNQWIYFFPVGSLPLLDGAAFHIYKWISSQLHFFLSWARDRGCLGILIFWFSIKELQVKYKQINSKEVSNSKTTHNEKIKFPTKISIISISPLM